MNVVKKGEKFYHVFYNLFVFHFSYLNALTLCRFTIQEINSTRVNIFKTTIKF